MKGGHEPSQHAGRAASGGTPEGGCDPEVPSPASNARPQAPERSRIFPLRPFVCLPDTVTVFVPSTFHAIQDFTHLSLFAGLLGAVLLLTNAIGQLLYLRFPFSSCILHEIFVIAVIGPCTPYICRILGTYDQHIYEKQTAVAELREEVTCSYEVLISSIDHLLNQAAESSATMAERSFESKRRDFVRFLERATNSQSQLVLTEVEEREMVKQFRAFVLRWLTVFRECSVDPVWTPKMVVTEEELDRCDSVAAIASLTLDRLKNTEVKFISDRRAEDQRAIMGFRQHQERLSMPQRLPGLTAVPTPRPFQTTPPPSEIELADRADRRQRLESDGPDSPGGQPRSPRPGASARRLEAPFLRRQAGMTWFLPCEWLRFGRYGCSGCSKRSGYPRPFQCTCMMLVILSKEHLMIMGGFCGALTIFLGELFHSCKAAWVHLPYLLSVLAYSTSLVVLLIRFEDIDIVQRLAKEAHDLEQERRCVQERREQMVAFWTELGQLTSIWTHRTVPRLDLLKEVQGHLEYCKPEDTIHLMAGANARFEALEQRLPELQSWRQDGGLSEEAKKSFAQGILHLCKEDNLPNIIHGLNCFIEHGLPEAVGKPVRHDPESIACA